MNNSKPLVAAIVLATASFASSSVLARTGTPTTRALNLTDNTAFFGDTFAAVTTGNQFTDRFTFTVNNATTGGTTGLTQVLDAIVSSISNTASMGLDITDLALYNTSNTQISSGTRQSSGRIDVWTLENNNLQNGDYYIQVRGNLLASADGGGGTGGGGDMMSTIGGSFGGAVMLAPVPEPGTYGMMLGGLGILAFLARGRKGKQA
jgi:hypothetical protein